jgi:hypothetical protein
MKKIIKNQKGFSFIEIILYMGIFSILMLAMFQLLTTVFDVQLESQSTSNVPQDGRYLLNKLSYEIGKTKNITSPSIGSSSAVMKLSDGAITDTYSLSDGNLILTSSPSGAIDQLNSYNTIVSNLNFLRLADIYGKNDTVTISFTITSKVIKRGGAAAQNYKITVGTRKN